MTQLQRYLHTGIFVILLVFISNSLSAQDFDSPRFVYKDEFGLGINVHANGWGISADKVYLKTIFKQRVLRFAILSLKHPREYKQPAQNGFGANSKNSGSFAYGKINSFHTLNVSFGRRHLIGEKGRKNGIEISYIYLVGPTLGLLNPYYLDIQEDFQSAPISYSIETQDVFLDNSKIRGYSGYFRGVREMKVVPGGQAQVSLHFDYALFDRFVNSLEAGIMVHAFYKRVPIMVTEDNHFIFPNLFLKFSIGKRK